MCLLALGMLLGLGITPVISSDHVFPGGFNHSVADFLRTPLKIQPGGKITSLYVESMAGCSQVVNILDILISSNIVPFS